MKYVDFPVMQPYYNSSGFRKPCKNPFDYILFWLYLFAF